VAKWLQEFDPRLIVERLDASRTVHPNGRVSFEAFAHQENMAVLRTMIEMDARIVPIDRSAIVGRAVTKAAASKLNPQRVLLQIRQLEQEHLSLPTQRYRLVSEISTSRSLAPIQRTIGSARIIVGWRIDKRTLDARLEEVRPGRSEIPGGGPKRYAWVSTSLDARTHAEAYTFAIDRLDLLRARWNLFLNKQWKLRSTFGRRSAVNPIVLGPVHTLHQLSGESAGKGWWQDYGYREEKLAWSGATKLQEMLQYESVLRTDIRRICYSETIDAALLRYVRALDLVDWSQAFLQLWSVIEMLTGAGVNASHRQTAKRATFPFQDSDHAFQSLLHLRENRNRSVHHGAESSDAETLMYQAKRTIEGLLWFHLRFAGKLKSMDEAASMLDSPSSLPRVKDEIRRLRRVMRYLGGS
jgi:hypothetical protein